MKRIVLFASGSGTNVENIIRYFQNNPDVTVATVLTNKRDAKVLDRCKKLNTSALYFNYSSLFKSDVILDILKCLNPDLIVLAGFLLKVPENIINHFPKKIINIHPALLPKYGGKGMFGMHVHKAVKENNDAESGITIHYVNKNYDEGAILCQFSTGIETTDTPEDIAAKVHELEYEHFPRIIENLLSEE
ncbi:MAG: phosphoribosylglycinamide formyltransferase [Eudoraea sp.]|nr:phosphoribosylglycinamide formyltransferase [Eudoraea sp.]